MNSVHLIGNLTDKPNNCAAKKDETKICTFTLAVEKNRGEKQVFYFDIVTFRELAANCYKYLEKGSKVAVHGYLQQTSWTDKNDNKRYSISIVADEVEFLSMKKPIDEPEKPTKDE